jgi:hypothetical protein
MRFSPEKWNFRKDGPLLGRRSRRRIHIPEKFAGFCVAGRIRARGASLALRVFATGIILFA